MRWKLQLCVYKLLSETLVCTFTPPSRSIHAYMYYTYETCMLKMATSASDKPIVFDSKIKTCRMKQCVDILFVVHVMVIEGRLRDIWIISIFITWSCESLPRSTTWSDWILYTLTGNKFPPDKMCVSTRNLNNQIVHSDSWSSPSPQ